MRYVFLGKYTQFMGRTFSFGLPVEVSDNATMKALEGRRDFAQYIEKEPDHAVRQETQVEQKEEVVVNVDACHKCGKVVKRGRYMHVKFCRGAP